MSIVQSISRRRNSYNLLNHPRFLRRFSVDVDPAPVIKSDSQEFVVVKFLENLRQTPQHDWASSESLSSLLVSSSSSSSVSPLVFSQITRRLGSYSLAVSFFEYLDAKSQSLKRRQEFLSLAFQSVIEFAGSEPESRDKLLRLYEIAKEKNIPLTVVATKLLIRWFGRMGMVNQSVLVYEQLDSNMKNTQVRNVVIDVLLKNGLVDDAFKVLDEMLHKESVFPPNRITADIVFHEVWRGRLLKEEEIIGLISRFSSHGVSPNSVWLTRFITSLCKNARSNVAWEILTDLMENKSPLEAPPFNALLSCLGRNMDIGRINGLVEKMDEMNIRPDVVTLGILINTLCKSRRVDEALQVFEQMCGKRTDGGNVIKADSIHFNTLIDGFCKVGRMKEAEDLLVRMKMEESCAPNTITYNCLIDGYCRAGQIETAKEVVSRMKEDGIKPNVVTLNTIVGGMCRYHGVNMAIHFFTDMEREGVKGNVVTYMILIHACCSVSNIEKAMHWFDKMLEAGCSPDAKIYYALISGLCQVRRDHDVIRVVEKLKQGGFSLDLFAYSMLIGLFCDKNNAEKVYEMLTEMEAAGMKPDSITYNTLISFFGRHKDFESVQTMMEQMREDGLDPTAVTYGAVIEAYCSAGELNEGKKLFKDMGMRSKVNPNTVIYNILIDAFSKLGNLQHALSLKEEMKQKMVGDSKNRCQSTMASSLVRSCSRASRVINTVRFMSNIPENTVYGGPKPQNPNQRVTLMQLRQKHRKGEPITVVTGYDYPSAVHIDTAGIDVCLVGDSASMVVHGHDTTLPISLDEMLLHCRAVARGAKRPLLVGDLPFGTYESSTTQAVDTAVRVLKEGGMDAIKLEGGSPSRITAAKSIVEAGIAVMGHVGLTPQSISVLGGFRPQGRNVASAVKVVETAMALQEAGCFSVVLECVPPPVAAAATSALHIPTIGIGAGPFCSGQVLVYHDLLGMMQHPHHAKVTPKFCKQYAQVGEVINKALLEYKEDVSKHLFPGPSHSPYKISSSDLDGFLSELQKLGLDKAASAAVESVEKMEHSDSPSSQ